MTSDNPDTHDWFSARDQHNFLMEQDSLSAAFRRGEGLSLLRFHRWHHWHDRPFVRFCVREALRTSRRVRHSHPRCRAEALGRAWTLRRLSRQ